TNSPPQGQARKLVSLSSSSAPSSPYGVGEMLQASKVEVDVLDAHVGYLTNQLAFDGDGLQSQQQVSQRYKHQAAIKPITTAEDEKRKQNPEILARQESAKSIRTAIDSVFSLGNSNKTAYSNSMR